MKTDALPNEPEENFLSIYKLYEMSRDYGIDIELLVDIEHESNDGGITLYHDDWYQFYPVYLVSESNDKIVIQTTVGNIIETDMEPIEVICTFEKTDGEWVRTIKEV